MSEEPIKTKENDMRYFKLILAVALVFSLLIGTSPVQAAEKVDFILNWIAGGDHAPYYYALQEGWYKDAGI
jgi:NitT/TauT family transport system substrate-binding protein